jgi:hypothetical protein
MSPKDVVVAAFKKDGAEAKATRIHAELEEIRAALRETLSMFEHSPKTQGTSSIITLLSTGWVYDCPEMRVMIELPEASIWMHVGVFFADRNNNASICVDALVVPPETPKDLIAAATSTDLLNIYGGPDDAALVERYCLPGFIRVSCGGDDQCSRGRDPESVYPEVSGSPYVEVTASDMGALSALAETACAVIKAWEKDAKRGHVYLRKEANQFKVKVMDEGAPAPKKPKM